MPVDVVHAGETNTVTVNQRENHAQWNLLGTFRFDPSQDVVVRVRQDGGFECNGKLALSP